MFRVYCYLEMNHFNHFIQKEETKCQELLVSHFKSNETETSCPPHFDGNYCWPPTPRMNLAKIQCPIEDYENIEITRWCSTNVTQVLGRNLTVAQWQTAYYGGCSLLRGRAGDIMYFFTLSVQDVDDSYLYWWHEKLSILDQIGYGLSIICLVLALSIFSIFRKLQDTRVKVHINLFIAMTLQSLMSLIQNFFYGCKIYYTILINSESYNEECSQICRALMTLSHYFELTIFAWLLIEGWYFYSFISRAPFNDYVTIKPHILAGWGLPLIVIIPWVVVHLYSTHTNFCWVDIDVKINIVAIPILLIVLINLCFFILNVRIIFIKMKNTYTSQKRMHYWKWIKSSLMLVPLFGTYDVLYGIWPWIENQQTKIAFLLIVRLICSFQGFIVATLYCFANGEVKRELKRIWNNWKLKREISSEVLKHHHSTETLNRIKFNDTLSDNGKTEFNNLGFNTYF